MTAKRRTIPADRAIYLLVGAANRDPEKFPDPEKLDINRPATRSLGFGYGIHFCLGAPLARIETAVTINTILQRLPNLRLDVDPSQLEWQPQIVSRALKALPVAF